MQKQSAPVPIGLAFIAALICAGAFFIFLLSPAFSRNSGQWDQEDIAISSWYRTLMQPDNPTISCCGEADAYWADDTEVKNGKVYAIITDTRDDAPLRRRHIPLGKKYEVPPEKITYRGGNPTGHIIIFIGINDNVLCYVMNGGV